MQVWVPKDIQWEETPLGQAFKMGARSDIGSVFMDDAQDRQHAGTVHESPSDSGEVTPVQRSPVSRSTAEKTRQPVEHGYADIEARKDGITSLAALVNEEVIRNQEAINSFAGTSMDTVEQKMTDFYAGSLLQQVRNLQESSHDNDANATKLEGPTNNKLLIKL